MILIICATLCTSISAQALPDNFKFSEPIILPLINMRDMLEHVAKWSGKQVVVASEEDLKPVMSLIIPAPVSVRTARKVIDALILLEGYELIDSGNNELYLHRILTPEQCEAINKGIGHVRLIPDKRQPRRRAAIDSNGDMIPTKELVVIRPAIQSEVEPVGAGKHATKPVDKPPGDDTPSKPTSKDGPR